jgi:hypothetical protein
MKDGIPERRHCSFVYVGKGLKFPTLPNRVIL